MIARIVVFLIIMAALYVGWIMIRRAMRGAEEKTGEPPRLKGRAGDVVDFERDPDTGVYKPNPPPGAGPGAGRGRDEPPGS